ncbi:MAG: hypothetical protein JEZ03_15480 [Bacteroidales bacterium]|nr:hypothetical protein [Bacteroidales bacterium]
MDFGKEDFDLLTQLQQIASTENWEQLMDCRLSVIHKNIILTHSNGGMEAKKDLDEAIEVYEKQKDELRKKCAL